MSKLTKVLTAILVLVGLVGCNSATDEEPETKENATEQTQEQTVTNEEQTTEEENDSIEEESVEEEPEQKPIAEMNQKEKVDGIVKDLESAGFDVQKDREQNGNGGLDIYFYTINGGKATVAISIHEDGEITNFSARGENAEHEIIVVGDILIKYTGASDSDRQKYNDNILNDSNYTDLGDGIKGATIEIDNYIVAADSSNGVITDLVMNMAF